MIRFYFSILFSICLFNLFAQKLNKSKHLNTTELDSKVLIDTLANGLAYYLINNETEEGKADIFFIVKAGYNQEKKGQFQVSHLLEHMAMNATTHFSNSEDYFKSEDQFCNAFTSWNYSGYYFKDVPSSNKQRIDDILLFMKDIDNDIILDSSTIESERMVVWNEILGGSGLNIHMKQQYIDQVIGSPGYSYPKLEDALNLKQFNRVALSEFYMDWYCANKEAIIIVGDIDTGKLAKQVKSLFSSLDRCPCVEEKVYAPFQWTNQVIIETHPEMEEVEMQLVLKRDFQPRASTNDYITLLQLEFIGRLINSRLGELGANSLPAVTEASAAYLNRYNEAGPRFSALLANAFLDKDEIERGFKQVMVELRRIKLHGFTEMEFQLVRKEILNRDILSKDHELNNYVAHQYINQFVLGEIYLGPDSEQKLINEILQITTLGGINKLTSDLINTRARDIILLAPSIVKPKLPIETDIEEWLRDVELLDIGPYQHKTTDIGSEKVLMTQNDIAEMASGSVNQRKFIESINVTSLTLSNGATVILKPLPGEGIEKGKVYLSGISRGGVNIYPNELDQLSGLVTPLIVLESGLNSLNPDELIEFKHNKDVDMYLYILEDEEGILGNAQSTTIESLFQLLYQYFVNARIDKDVYTKLVHKYSVSARNTNNSQLIDSLKKVMGIHPRRDRLRVDEISKVNLDRGYEIFRERFSGVSDFTFILTGDFDVDEITVFIERYIGSLKPSGTDVAFRTAGAKIGNLNAKKIVSNLKSFEPARVQLFFAGAYEWSFENEIVLDVLKLSLQEVLRKRLREKEGGTYNVSCGVSKNRDGLFCFSCGFQCDSIMVEKMLTWSLEEIEKLQSVRMDSRTFEIVRQMAVSKLEDDLSSSKFWSEYLKNQVKRGALFNTILRAQNFIQGMTPESIRNAAELLLSKERHFELISLPKYASSSSGR